MSLIFYVKWELLENNRMSLRAMENKIER